MSNIDILTEFCSSRNILLLEEVDLETKDLLIKVSEFCVKNNMGDVDLARLILFKFEDWEYDIIPRDTLLYRGTKKQSIPKDHRAWYATLIDTANLYLPTNKEGYLNIYRVKQDLRLFKLDSIKNANKLLKITFPYKEIVKTEGKRVIKNYTLYDIIRLIYTGEYVHPEENKPLKIKRLVRLSCVDNDSIFAEWLCNHGFAGYNAEIMKQKICGDFPAELMICTPENILEIVDHIRMRKAKNKAKLQEIINRYN